MNRRPKPSNHCDKSVWSSSSVSLESQYRCEDPKSRRSYECVRHVSKIRPVLNFRPNPQFGGPFESAGVGCLHCSLTHAPTETLQIIPSNRVPWAPGATDDENRHGFKKRCGTKNRNSGRRKGSKTLLTFRHRSFSMQDMRFATLQRTLFIYLINKYRPISLSDIYLTVHH